MIIPFFCPRWGSEELPWDQFCRKVKQEGYDGIEYAIASQVTEKELDEVWNLAAKQDLAIIAQHYDTYDADFNRHFDRYSAWLQKLKPYPVEKINSQTGKDFFSFSQNALLIKAATNSGLPVVHETHRNKFSFAAHVMREYLESLPDLRIALDASHWVCVAESYLDDQPEAMQLAISRTAHIHARVGYPEGPQVPDPRVPEWEEALNKHLNWWDRAVALRRKEGTRLTITAEFGPFPYMVHMPATGTPIANQWEVNSYLMQLLKKRYHHPQVTAMAH
jgi:sugar phosphate isomerase/epimerase